jgi:hypothetical protein
MPLVVVGDPGTLVVIVVMYAPAGKDGYGNCAPIPFESTDVAVGCATVASDVEKTLSVVAEGPALIASKADT